MDSVQTDFLDQAIENKCLAYPESQLDSWKNRDYSMLNYSNAPEYLRKILEFKAKRRNQNKMQSDRRFFGEAYVAATIPMKYGWYNSYNWLSDIKWVTGKGLKNTVEEPFERMFYDDALMKFIGRENLLELQKHATGHYSLEKKPKAPDLWIIDKNNDFSFIEVKLPGDRVKPQQLLGMKLIKNYLKTKNSNPIKVYILNLYPSECR